MASKRKHFQTLGFLCGSTNIDIHINAKKHCIEVRKYSDKTTKRIELNHKEIIKGLS